MASKRNKKYTGPKFVSINPMADIFGGMSDTHAEHLQRLFVINHGALAALSTGTGGRKQWDLMVGAVNFGTVLCEQGIGDEFREVIMAGRDALQAMGIRGVKTGRFVFKGDELKAMSAALECHDAQLENIRAIDLERAHNEVTRRLRYKINTTSVVKEARAS